MGLLTFICSNTDTNLRFVTASSQLDFFISAASRVLVFHSCFLLFFVRPSIKSEKMNGLAQIFLDI